MAEKEKKSFEELDLRLRHMEQSNFLPAEDIISAQKAVAKVTISRSKENTDALMNSNDELINQLVNIQEKLDDVNKKSLKSKKGKKKSIEVENGLENFP